MSGQIELTAEELKNILDEAYWEGYRNNNHSWTYSTPNWTPYVYTATGTQDITLSTACTGDIVRDIVDDYLGAKVE